jgi:two-component system sensor histidine kinase/response regulator
MAARSRVASQARSAGLDTADGVRRVMGRREVYIGLLRRFVSSQAGAPAAIRASLGDRRADAERAAHTLKGLAGTIGARPLQRDAGAVEAALRRGATAVEIDDLLATLEQSLESLVAAILSALAPEAGTTVRPASVDPLVLRQAVERLELALSDEDAVEAIDAFQLAEPILSAAFGEHSERIGKLVRSYRFVDALAALRDASSS